MQVLARARFRSMHMVILFKFSRSSCLLVHLDARVRQACADQRQLGGPNSGLDAQSGLALRRFWPVQVRFSRATMQNLATCCDFVSFRCRFSRFHFPRCDLESHAIGARKGRSVRQTLGHSRLAESKLRWSERLANQWRSTRHCQTRHL